MGLRATLGPPAPLVPGDLSHRDLTVENTGDRHEEVRLSLAGEPAAWGWITPAALSLNPGEDGQARLTFRLPRVPHGFGTGVNWGRIILHELAHVIGLGHVESRTSLMNEALTQQTLSSAEWGVGDLIGLRHLGRDGGCVAVPPVPPQGAPR